MTYLPTLGIAASILLAAFLNWRASKKEPDPNKLVIHFAHWGKGTRRWEYRNVAKVLRGYIKNDNMLDHTIDYFSLGDPFPGKAKYMLLKYSLGGITRIVTLKEGQRVTILSTDTNLDFQIARKREWMEKAEDLQRELDQARQYDKLILALRDAHVPVTTGQAHAIFNYHISFPKGREIASKLAGVFAQAGWKVDGEIRSTHKPENVNGMWVSRSTPAVRKFVIDTFKANKLPTYEEKVVEMDGQIQPLDITVCRLDGFDVTGAQ